MIKTRATPNKSWQDEETVFTFEDENNFFECRSFGTFKLSYTVHIVKNSEISEICKILGHIASGHFIYTICDMGNNMLSEHSCPRQAFFEAINLFKKGELN
jgi:hypothetical protein